MSLSQSKTQRRDLVNTYLSTPQLGLVLGAGVTVDSGVPMYAELALRLLEYACEQGILAVSPQWVSLFVEQQRELLAEEDRKTMPPEEVVQFVRAHLEGGRQKLNQLIKEVLYEKAPVKRTVGREAFERNPTLNAILTFCAARPGTTLAAPSKYEIETNSKVGGLLTTNYDNLVEGAFHTKYRRNLLKPVGRPTSREAARDRRVIPIYHIHGYISYREPDDASSDQKTPPIVITEDDFFQTFYDPLGFGNYIAMSFLRRFPCLFIGSALTDPNLRRFLFHLARDGGRSTPHQRKFALLRVTGTPEDHLTEAVLQTYGVAPIWLDDFSEIPEILRTLYTAAADIEESDWDDMARYKW